MRMLHWAKSLRLGEVLLMTGFALMGVFVATDRPGSVDSVRAALFFAGIYLLFTSIYSLNGWFGYRTDLGNPRLAYLMERLDPRLFLYAAIASGVLSMAVLARLGALQLTLAVFTMILWILYSSPRVLLKGVPGAGTAVHVASMTAHFAMGYAVVEPPGAEGVAKGLYFALLFAGGHVHHELIDRGVDTVAGIRTGVVAFGGGYGKWGGYAIFAVAAVLWVSLFCLEIIRLSELVPFAAAFLLQTAAWLHLSPRFGEPAGRVRYRTVYRAVYLLAGLSYILVKWVSPAT